LRSPASLPRGSQSFIGYKASRWHSAVERKGMSFIASRPRPKHTAICFGLDQPSVCGRLSPRPFRVYSPRVRGPGRSGARRLAGKLIHPRDELAGVFEEWCRREWAKFKFQRPISDCWHARLPMFSRERLRFWSACDLSPLSISCKRGFIINGPPVGTSCIKGKR